MAKKKAKKWVQAADIKKGTLTKKAMAAGMTVPQFCAEAHRDPTTVRQCNLAKTFSKMRKG